MNVSVSIAGHTWECQPALSVRLIKTCFAAVAIPVSRRIGLISVSSVIPAGRTTATPTKKSNGEIHSTIGTLSLPMTKKAKKKDNGKPKKLDVLKECLRYWSLIVRQRDGYQCWIDGCEKELVQAHHIFPKKHYPATMFEISNGATLCRGHHAFFAESDYERFRTLVIGRIGLKAWIELKERANRKESYTIDDLIDIREKLKRMVDR